LNFEVPERDCGNCLQELQIRRTDRGKPCFLAKKPYKPSLPLAPGRELNGRLQAFSSTNLGEPAAGSSGPASGVPAF
jgi:hypothetical protein